MKLDLKAAHTIYLNSAGKPLTGVTTYLGVLAKPSLMAWYATEERKGVLAEVERYLKESGVSAFPPDLPKRPFAEMKRDGAADLGTVTHARVEAFLKNETLDPEGIPEDIYKDSLNGYTRFINWWISEGMSVVHSELSMVVEDNWRNYGGTADIIARDREGNLTLIDLKTSKKSRGWPYAEIFAQVAAYANAYEHNYGHKAARIVIVRIGKEAKDSIQVVEVSEAKRVEGWHLFCAAYDAYEAKKALERME